MMRESQVDRRKLKVGVGGLERNSEETGYVRGRFSLQIKTEYSLFTSGCDKRIKQLLK